jgi:methionyl-tRNA formyltransferase
MKSVLVTSRVTYVPQNYLHALRGALESAPGEIAGLVLLDNLEYSLLGRAAGLYALGCPRLASTLSVNILGLSVGIDPRVKLFEKAGLPVVQFESMNSTEALNWIGDNEIDLIVNMRTRCVYKEQILNKPRLGCINIHHGLLPDYRGTMCDLYALAEGRAAGFSIHVMTKKIDAGPILRRYVVSPPGSGHRDYVEYLESASRIEGVVLADLLKEIAKRDEIPDGIANEARIPVYSRNPDRSGIRRLRDGGLAL